jgi:hypothetical protein
MKKVFLLLIFSFINLFAYSGIGDFNYVPNRRRIKYVEEFYNQYKLNMHYNTDNLLANIHWLQIALYAPFDHPIRAMALIRTPQEHDKYKRLFKMRIHFLVMKSYLMLGRRYDKKNIYYFNREYKKELLAGFAIARIYYKRAEHYWLKANFWAKKAWELKHLHLIGSEVDKMQNQMFFIVTKYKWMNYTPIIEKLIRKLKEKEEMLK